MKRLFRTCLFQEANWWVAQCLEADIASQGGTPEEAWENIAEAIALAFKEPAASTLNVSCPAPKGATILEVEVEL